MENADEPQRPEPHRRPADYDDPRFHDEDLDLGLSEDGERRPPRPTAKKPSRRPRQHRYYEE